MGTRYASPCAGARGSDLSLLVPERDVIAALLSRDECAALLARLASLSSGPTARSASRALLGLLGRLATPACTWIEGALAVELFEEGAGTKVRVMSDIGAGLRERVLPVVVFSQSIDQLVVGFARRAELAMVLRLERISSRCALIVAFEEESAPVSAELDISESSLAHGAAPKAPEEIDSGWDDASSA